MQFDVERVERMATRHIEAIVLGATEGQVRAALRQFDKANGLAGRVEHHHAVEVFGLAFELIDFAGAEVGRLRL